MVSVRTFVLILASLVLLENRFALAGDNDFLEGVPELSFIDDLEGRDELAAKETLSKDKLYVQNVKLHRDLLARALKEGLAVRTQQLDADSAKVMQTLAGHLRRMGLTSLPTGPDIPPDIAQDIANRAVNLRDRCEKVRVEFYPGALATLNQILQIGDTPLRLVLVEQLAKSRTSQATKMLVQRAVFDLDAKVRTAALAALKKRSAAGYASLLVEYLDYPWPAAQEHAQALLKTLPTKVVGPFVEKKLEALDTPLKDKRTGKLLVRELVRLNHLRNCLVCHAPYPVALDQIPRNATDPRFNLVRAGIPMPGKPLVSYYGGKLIGEVRADVTTLRPDYSVVLDVRNAKPWPERQRFDFITRLRPATEKEIEKAKGPDRQDLQKILEAIRKE